MQLHRRLVPAKVRAIEGKRSGVVAVINTADVDRHASIVDPIGARLENFAANPVVLWSHGDDPTRGAVPIARVVAIKASDQEITVELEFDEADVFAADIARKYREGFLRGFSIGFMPLGHAIETDGDRYAGEIVRYTDWELVELSAVSVPSNPYALAQ